MVSALIRRLSGTEALHKLAPFCLFLHVGREKAKLLLRVQSKLHFLMP